MPGVVNNCLQFDGVDDYVEVDLTPPSTDMTHELWFKTSVPDGGLFCVADPSHATCDRRLYLRDGNLYACFANDDPIGSSGLNLADGQWHHVAHVFGVPIEGQQLYVDGHLVARGDTTGSTFSEPTHLLFGCCPDIEHAYFAGQLSDVRVWNTLASPEQISDYMHIRLWGTEAGLFGYWPFKGGKPDADTDSVAEQPQKKRGQKSQVTAVDKTRRKHGRIYGARRIADADLQLEPPPSLTNPALIFDGTDDYLEFPNPFLNTQRFTIELWVLPEHLEDGPEYGIIGYVDADGRCKPSLSLVGASGGLRYDSYDEAGTRYTGVLEQFFEQADAWVHVAWVNDGEQYRFYRNGKLFHTVEEGPAHFSAPADTPYWVGRVGHVWAGQLAEVRVWETDRTPKQLRQQMKHRLRGNEEGLVACWPLNEGTGVITDVTDKSHNGRVFGARLGNTTLQFRAPKAAPSGVAIASSTYIVQPASIAELLRDDNPFKALYQRLQDATTTAEDGSTVLPLDASVLGEFNLFDTLNELRVTSLPLKDTTLEFISEESEIDWDSREAEKFMGLRLSGTTELLGLADAQATLECVLDDDDFEPAAVLKLQPLGDIHLPVERLLSTGITPPASIQRLLDYIGHLHIACPVLAVANESVEGETEYPFNLGIDEGLNIYGVIDLTSTGGTNPFVLIRQWLDVEELSLHTTLCKHTTGWQVTQEAMVGKDTPVLSGAGVELVYKGATVSVEIGGHPPEVAIMLSNTLLLSLNWFDAEDIYLTGSMKLEPESFTGAYTLQQSPGSANEWNPFGISGVSVQALAMQMGGTYLAPWIDNVGIATEDVVVGNTRSSLALLVDTNDPDQFVFHLAMNQTTLLELISAFTPVTFAAYRALPRHLQRLLETIIDIDFQDVVIHIVPAPTRIGDLVFDDEGIMVKGIMSPWGWDAKVDMVVDWDDMDLSVEVEPVDLHIGGLEVFALTGIDEDSYPRLQFARGEEVETSWYVASELRLLKTRHILFSQRQEAVTVLKLDSYVPLLNIGLLIDRRDDSTTINGHFNLVLDVKKPGHSLVLDEREMVGTVVRLGFELTNATSELTAGLAADVQFRWGARKIHLALAPRFTMSKPDLNPIKRLVKPASTEPTEAEQEQGAVAEPVKSTATHQAAAHNGAHPARRNGRKAFAARLLQDTQHVSQQAVVTVQDAGVKVADVADIGADMLRTVVSVANGKRARRQKTRLWLQQPG